MFAARLRTASLAAAVLLFAGTSAPAQDAATSRPFAETPAERDARMAWWREARFGMFIHWGVYSALGGSWNGKAASGTGEWIFQNAKPPMSEYERAAARFDPRKYDPAAWAKLAREAGMKYVVITAKHHDGFCLYDSAHSDWDVARTPGKRDLLAPLAAACREEGLKFCTYFTIMDWRHPDYAPRRPWNDLATAAGPPVFERFTPFVHAQVEEVIAKYDPALLWFDGEWEDSWTVAHGEALEALVRARKPSIVVNNRVGKSRNDMAGLDKPGVKKAGDYGTPEQEVPARGLPGVDWETCMTMNDTWGFRADDERWKSPTTLIRTLCDVASKGGNFLLNVGPTGEGEIPAASVERLRALGAWMATNAEAIHGSSASPFERLPFGRATQKGRMLYLHVFDWPADGVLRLPGLRTATTSATLLADPSRVLTLRRETDATVIEAGPRAPDAACSVVRVALDGPLDVDAEAALPRPDAAGVLVLRAGDATVHDGALCGERFPDAGGAESLGCWTSEKTWISFDVSLPAAATYVIALEFACDPTSAGASVTLGFQEPQATATSFVVPTTGGWRTFVVQEIGVVVCRSPGRRTLELKVRGKPGAAVMNFRGLRLTPTP